MKIHEYQAKELFRKNGVAVPDGQVAFTVAEAKTAAEKLGSYPVVVKAQIHAGGRGLGGGVKVAKNEQEFNEYANSILGMNLITKQTGPGGKVVKNPGDRYPVLLPTVSAAVLDGGKQAWS